MKQFTQPAHPAHRSMTLVRIPIDSIFCDCLPQEEEIADLKESIGHIGMLEPVAVTRSADGYNLLYGKRRFAACKALDFQYINAVLMSLSPEDAALVPLADTMHQCSRSLAEQAKALKAVAERLDCDPISLGGLLNLPDSLLHSILLFLQLPVEVQTLAEHENFQADQLEAILRYSDPADCYKAAEKVAARTQSALLAADNDYALHQSVKLSLYSDKRLFVNAVRDIASQMRRAGYGGCIYERDGEIVIRTGDEKITSMAQ